MLSLSLWFRRTGTINFKQFEHVIRKICVMTPAEMEVLWKVADTNNNGQVKYYQFMEFIAGRDKAAELTTVSRLLLLTNKAAPDPQTHTHTRYYSPDLHGFSVTVFLASIKDTRIPCAMTNK